MLKSAVSRALAHLPNGVYYAASAALRPYEKAHDDHPASLPPLRPEHTAHARVLPNRAALLAALPTRGTAAELGVDRGDFSAEILATVRPHVLHLVDLWGSSRYGEAERARVAARFAAEGARVVVHRTDSVAAAGAFSGGSLDFVYVDTAHDYATTVAELRAYAPKVAPGGVLAGHDYSMGNWRQRYRYGVMEAVQVFCVEAGWGIRYLTAEIGERQSFGLVRLGE